MQREGGSGERSVARTRRDCRFELPGRHPSLLDRAQRCVELLRRRLRDAAHDVAEIELVALRDILHHLGGHGVAHQRVPEGALALLHAAIDEQPENRSEEEDGNEHEGEHGDDPMGASPGCPGLSRHKKSHHATWTAPSRRATAAPMRRRARTYLLVGSALLLVGAGTACRQPGPTYEYEETETTITTTPPRGREVTTSTVAPSKSPAWKRGEGR